MAQRGVPAAPVAEWAGDVLVEDEGPLSIVAARGDVSTARLFLSLERWAGRFGAGDSAFAAKFRTIFKAQRMRFPVSCASDPASPKPSHSRDDAEQGVLRHPIAPDARSMRGTWPTLYVFFASDPPHQLSHTVSGATGLATIMHQRLKPRKLSRSAQPVARTQATARNANSCAQSPSRLAKFHLRWSV